MRFITEADTSHSGISYPDLRHLSSGRFLGRQLREIAIVGTGRYVDGEMIELLLRPLKNLTKCILTGLSPNPELAVLRIERILGNLSRRSAGSLQSLHLRLSLQIRQHICRQGTDRCQEAQVLEYIRAFTALRELEIDSNFTRHANFVNCLPSTLERLWIYDICGHCNMRPLLKHITPKNKNELLPNLRDVLWLGPREGWSLVARVHFRFMGITFWQSRNLSDSLRSEYRLWNAHGQRGCNPTVGN